MKLGASFAGAGESRCSVGLRWVSPLSLYGRLVADKVIRSCLVAYKSEGTGADWVGTHELKRGDAQDHGQQRAAR